MRYVFYDNTLEECTKPSDTSTIGHACIGDDTGGYPETKIEDFAPGRENAICQIVDCETKAVFGIKDGSMCDDAGAGGGGDFTCEGGFSCGGKQRKACKWSYTAPSCDDYYYDEYYHK